MTGGLLPRPAGPPHDLHRRHTAAPYRPAITRTWPDRQATDVIEVIVMTASLGQRPASSGSRLRALGRSARTLRNLYAEQADAWERFFRAGLPAQPGAQDSAAGLRVHVPAPRPAPDASPAKSR